MCFLFARIQRDGAPSFQLLIRPDHTGTWQLGCYIIHDGDDAWIVAKQHFHGRMSARTVRAVDKSACLQGSHKGFSGELERKDELCPTRKRHKKETPNGLKWREIHFYKMWNVLRLEKRVNKWDKNEKHASGKAEKVRTKWNTKLPKWGEVMFCCDDFMQNI